MDGAVLVALFLGGMQWYWLSLVPLSSLLRMRFPPAACIIFADIPWCAQGKWIPTALKKGRHFSLCDDVLLIEHCCARNVRGGLRLHFRRSVQGKAEL